MRHTLTTMLGHLHRRRRHVTPLSALSTRDAGALLWPPSLVKQPAADRRTRRIDDPGGKSTILVLDGRPTGGAMAELTAETASIDPPVRLFLDLSAASIPTGSAMRRLEAFIDHLEARGFDIEVTGVNPKHPTLRS